MKYTSVYEELPFTIKREWQFWFRDKVWCEKNIGYRFGKYRRWSVTMDGNINTFRFKTEADLLLFKLSS